ncbi:MAG: S8 family serine peptidase [Lysobacteraceae bacterium]
MSRINKWGVAAGVSVLIAAAAAAAYQYTTNGPGAPVATDDAGLSASNATSIPAGPAVAGGAGSNGANPAAGSAGDARQGRGTYIVVFKEAALASYKGTVPGIGAPERVRDEQGTLRLNAEGDNAQEYVDYLQVRQQQMEARMSTMAGRDVAPRLTMQHALNGMIVDLAESEASAIRRMPDVRLVEEYREVPMDTDLGPQLIGATPVWTGSNPGAPGPFRGENVVYGVIDSGINFGSPSFAAVGPVDGFVHNNPLGAGNYLGTCDVGGVDAGRCNDKLIGGYDFVCNAPANVCGGTSIREEPGFGDTNGHGSHTASTGAGNTRDVLFSGNTLRISGVAPHANLIAYDVCYTNTATGQGLCPNVSSVAAVNQAVADGIVDAINFSIGGGVDPWSDSVSLAFLNAVDSGIYVASSAGNSGPAANTLGHNEPWVSATAASQTGRGGFSTALQVTGPTPVPANLAPLLVNEGTGGVALSATIPGTTPLLISAGISTTSDGCAAYPANAFAGAIAVIRRGTCSFTIKTNNASAAGAVAVVIANNAAGVILPSVPGTTIPVFSVTQAEGDALRDFGQANPTTTTAQITFPPLPIPNTPDALASFSSRGPAGTYNLLKPDITAPGSQILAAVSDTVSVTGSPEAVALFSGTSMASPHQAGAAMLVRQARPTWTPPEIKSALALTAAQTVLLEDQVTPANPFARGSGRVQVDRAINAGLVMNETTANYAAANPATGGDPTTLNQPNLFNRSCYPTCAFFRTFRNTGASATTWRVQLVGVSGSVTPIITVPGNGSLTVKFTIYGFSLAPNGTASFGTVVLTPATGTAPVLRMPVGVSVQPPVISMPASLSSSLSTNSAGSTSFTIGNTGGSNLSYTFLNSGTAPGSLVNTTGTVTGSGFRSTSYTDPATAGNQAQFSADDFVLTQSTQITSLFVEGFTLVAPPLSTVSPTLTWSLYPDAGGLPAGNPRSAPGAAVWTYTAGATSAGVTTISDTNGDNILLNLTAAGQNVTLPPGRYWLVVNANSTFANRWNWFITTQVSGASGIATIIVSTTGTGAWAANATTGLSMRVNGLLPCGAPWISGTYATTGTLARGASRSALTAINSTGLAAGSYLGNVCVQSNDPATPVLAVPLSLTVTP